MRLDEVIHKLETWGYDACRERGGWVLKYQGSAVWRMPPQPTIGKAVEYVFWRQSKAKTKSK